MPTEMELTLEQTQQGVSYEVSNIRVISFTMKMEILLEPTSNKLMVERFYTSAGNPVKEILLKLNLPDHRILKDGGEVKEFQRSFRHSDTERLSRSDEVLKSFGLAMAVADRSSSKRASVIRAKEKDSPKVVGLALKFYL
ncbi:hypothetical protein Tco_0984967 [Tanacetum coccineum]